MKIFITTLTIIFSVSCYSQNRVAVYIKTNYTQIMNKQPQENNFIFNEVQNFENKEPFWGTLKKMTPLLTKDFGIIVNFFSKKKINLYGCAGSQTMGHREFILGGKGDDYLWAPVGTFTGDTLFISNKIYNYFFYAGIKTEYKLAKNLFAEAQLNYIKNGNNANKTIKTFRSVFDTEVISSHSGTLKKYHVPYTNVNYHGAMQLFIGFNANINSRFKIHLLYMRTLTPHTAFLKSVLPDHYQGASLQLSYSFLNPNKGNDY